MLPHEHRNVLFVSDNEEIRDIGMFLKDDSIIQTLSGKSYGHKSEKASIYAYFNSLKQVSKLFISRDIDDFAYGNFSYRVKWNTKEEIAQFRDVSRFFP